MAFSFLAWERNVIQSRIKGVDDCHFTVAEEELQGKGIPPFSRNDGARAKGIPPVGRNDEEQGKGIPPFSRNDRGAGKRESFRWSE